MSEYLLDRFGVDKISIVGISSDAVFRANLLLDHPERYDSLIAMSMIVNGMESRKTNKERAPELVCVFMQTVHLRGAAIRSPFFYFTFTVIVMLFPLIFAVSLALPFP